MRLRRNDVVWGFGRTEGQGFQTLNVYMWVKDVLLLLPRHMYASAWKMGRAEVEQAGFWGVAI